MTTAEAILIFTFAILALGFTVSAFVAKSGRMILAFAGAGAWMLLGAYSYTELVAVWDIYYALFWLSMGMVVVCVLIPAILKEKKEDEVTVDDVDNYGDRELLDDIEASDKDEERLNKLFGNRRRRTKRMSRFSKTGKQ